MHQWFSNHFLRVDEGFSQRNFLIRNFRQVFLTKESRREECWLSPIQQLHSYFFSPQVFLPHHILLWFEFTPLIALCFLTLSPPADGRVLPGWGSSGGEDSFGGSGSLGRWMLGGWYACLLPLPPLLLICPVLSAMRAKQLLLRRTGALSTDPFMLLLPGSWLHARQVLGSLTGHILETTTVQGSLLILVNLTSISLRFQS